MKTTFIILLAIILLSILTCKSSKVQAPPAVYTYNSDTTGTEISIEFTRGSAFNHPLLAIWIEDQNGNFVQTLYVSESLGKGIFQHGDAKSGKWMPGPVMRPAALPYWSHRRGIRNSLGLYLPDAENPIPDAYTGPTPPGDFVLNTKIENTNLRKFSVYLEINQTWDWNEFWTNDKYPDDDDYKTSCQPALVYKTGVDLDEGIKTYEMAVIGHSHYSGKNGELFPDISTITTALNIVKNISITIR
jgi:hypothetical protein